MKDFTRLSLLLSLSIVLSIIESTIPFFSGAIPGMKLGLANIVTLFILYKYGFKSAIYVGVLRVFVVGILRTGLFGVTFYLSFSGMVFSLCFMYLAMKFKFSIIGVSVVGSFFHTLGQVIAVNFITSTNMMAYFPILIVVSVFSGVIVGIIGNKLLLHFEKI